MQVVVADDGSPRPPTMPRWTRHPSPLIVRQPDLGFRAGAARNLGASVGDGDVLIFLDGDTVPALDFVRRLASWPARLPDALAVGLRHHVDLGGWEPSRLTSWLRGGGKVDAPRALDDPTWLADGYRETRSLLDADDRSYRFVISAVLACSRRLFEELGGFDPRFVGYGGEDWELAFRAFNAGAVLVHEPLAVAWHDGPDQGARAPDPEAKAVERERLDELVPVGREFGFPDERALLRRHRRHHDVGSAPATRRRVDPRPIPRRTARRGWAWFRRRRGTRRAARPPSVWRDPRPHRRTRRGASDVDPSVAPFGAVVPDGSASADRPAVRPHRDRHRRAAPGR